MALDRIKIKEKLDKQYGKENEILKRTKDLLGIWDKRLMLIKDKLLMNDDELSRRQNHNILNNR